MRLNYDSVPSFFFFFESGRAHSELSKENVWFWLRMPPDWAVLIFSCLRILHEPLRNGWIFFMRMLYLKKHWGKTCDDSPVGGPGKKEEKKGDRKFPWILTPWMVSVCLSICFPFYCLQFLATRFAHFPPFFHEVRSCQYSRLFSIVVSNVIISNVVH